LHRIVQALALLIAVSALAGCGALGYYGQAISGHYSILGRTRPIDQMLADPATAPETKAKLTRVLAMRDFASRALALPDNDSYRHYADLERPFAVWNVFAAPELSLKAKEWCFVFVGCVAYRGYFDRAAAERVARDLQAEGFDVYVGGVTAYSTLGWFSDPLLNTMIGRPEPELAGLIFHELAHQLLYVRGDTVFNESFATTVEREGVRRWLATQNAPAEYAAYLDRTRRREELMALIMGYRAQLAALYESDREPADKRAGKHALLEALQRDYRQWKQRWHDFTGFDGWVENFNNAKFVSIGLYHDYLAAFDALLARHGGDLPAFYRAVEALAREPTERRAQQLAQLASAAAVESAQ
jgi:predicted aminopeptidase